MPFFSSSSSTTLFILLFILAFFPSAFFDLIRLPFRQFYTVPDGSKSSPCPPSCPTHQAPYLPAMFWVQKTITLPSKSRGSYLVTSHVINALPEIKNYRVGLLHLFIQHTSCALSLNENYDEDVRADMSDALDRIVPEDSSNKGLYRHDAEGPDDMPV